MRLTSTQVRLVKDSVLRHFGSDARVWVFGSRIDDERRGGDYDLLIETASTDAAGIIDAKLGLLADLHATSDFEGEKIDVVVRSGIPGPDLPIYQAAREQGVRL